MIVDKEWGLAGNENPLQGSLVLDQLANRVEEAVLAPFDRISERGSVLGAMETCYQRGKIQDESMLYEQRKHQGSLPIVGVNVFTAADACPASTAPRPRRLSWPGPPRPERGASWTGWPASRPGTPGPPRPRYGAARRRRPAAGASSRP